jgi:murein DD-endopeptidase MepM/ murein hydrolase activator NlpD
MPRRLFVGFAVLALLVIMGGCGVDRLSAPRAPSANESDELSGAAQSVGTDRLNPGEYLYAGQRISSPRGTSSLTMQVDGNLVVYHKYSSGWVAKWASGTAGVSGARVIMQRDGNLVVYDPQGHPKWASNTNGASGSVVVIQNDGNLVIYDPQGHPRWASNTVCEMSSGWYWPTGTDDLGSYLGWLGYSSGWGYHLAKDMKNAASQPVYSIGAGEIINSGEHKAYGNYGNGTGGCILARYKSANGTWFTVLYGHLDNYRGTGSVQAGEIIGYTLPDWNPTHLHFAVHPGYDPEPTNPWRGYTSSKSNVYGFVDPVGYLKGLQR